jgi:sulfide:quinone oxidoreductase
MTRVLIAGSGVAAVECVLALRALAGARVDVELLAPAAELVQRPESVRTPFGGAAAPLYLAADLSVLPVVAEVSEQPLWSPPAKIAGRYLAPLLEA